jgi:mannose-6-phosphate isomerase-like protein (cupin superfamily)
MQNATVTPATKKNYQVAQLPDIPAVRCPCGFTRRAFGFDGSVATMHLLDLQKDAEVHYHKKLTEMYLILEGEGYMELDGELVPVKPMTAVYIKPGCRHRAVGKDGQPMKIIVVPVPAFDPEDEWFD